MRKLNVTVLIGLLVAIMGFGMVFAYGSRVDDRVAEGKRTVPVVVAVAALPVGAAVSSLTEKQVAVRQVPAAYVAQGALADLTSVKDQVLLGPVAPGAQLTATQFGTPGATGVLAPAKGRVALAIGVALTPGVARYITPGSAVDVFVTYGATGGGGGQGGGQGGGTGGGTAQAGQTKLFASGVGVLSVSAAGAATDGGAAGGGDGQVVAVLDLSPREAEKVVNAATLGQIYLALASKSDGAPHKTDGATPADVLGSNR